VIVDANVLLYAVDSTASFHTEARTWLQAALMGPSRVGLPWPSLLAFQRLATHPRVFANPLSAEQAWTVVQSWLAAPAAWVPVPGPKHAAVLEELLLKGDIRGNLVPDAHLAALAIENGVGVCSFDSDFARFSAVTWFRPGSG
jgi:toxin-antitoxin system PIN domain toxin